MTIPTTLAATRTDFCRALADATAPAVRSLRQWAEEELVIPEGEYAGQRWSADTQPYSGLLFDAMDSHRWPRHVVTGCVQSGKTLHAYVAPTLYYLFELHEGVINGIPTMTMAHDKLAKDLRPAIKANPKYRELLPLKGPGSREGVGNLESVAFRNGADLKFMSAGGGDEQRSGYTARVLVATEIDKYDEAAQSSRETDPISQMENRLASKDIFERRLFAECTVSVPDGRVWKEYQGGTASKIVCPCPHCGEFVCPEREHLRGWQEAETELAAIHLAHFCCPACGHAISEIERRAMNAAAKLLHRGQTIDRGGVIHGEPPETLTLGFRWNAFNNMFWSTGAIGWKEWKALRAEEREAVEKELVQFYWVTPYESPDVELTKFNVEDVQKRYGTEFKGVVPADAEKLTIGIDLHKRLGWYVVVAWQPLGCGHIVDYGRFDIPSDDLGEQRAFQVALRDFRDRCLAGWSWAGHSEPFLPDQVWMDCRYQGQGRGRPVGDGVVYGFCRESGPRFRPCLGFGASQRGAVPYLQPKKKDKKAKFLGEQYHIDWEAEANVHVAKINSDFWKTQLKEALAIPACDAAGNRNPGSITLFASTDKNEHITFAHHIDAEGPEQQFSENVGATIVWRTKSRSNHLGDAAYLAKTAGHFVGVRTIKTERIAAIAARPPQPIASPTKSIRPDGRPFLITNRKSA